MDALAAAGVFYHFVPKKYGGLEFGLLDLIDIVMPIAESCMSTAWVTSFCMQHNFLAAQFPAEGQDEIFREFPYTIAAGTAAPPSRGVKVEGGYLVDGRIGYASGIVHSNWAQFVANVAAEGEAPDMRFMMVPIDQVQILDTWYVDGLAATGSNDILLKDLFVPERRTVSFEALRSGSGHGAELYDNPLFKVPVDILLNISSSIPAIGTARATVAEFQQRVRSKGTVGPDGQQTFKSASLMRLAEAELMANCAEMLLRQAASETEEAPRQGHMLSGEERVRIRSRIAYAVELARNAVRVIADGAGSSAHALSNPIQRAARDTNMIASHAVYDRDSALELWGKVLVGAASADSFKHHSAAHAARTANLQAEVKQAGQIV
jgi:alkylation response protein AidB-like acyl-CoA dehydrogenase